MIKDINYINIQGWMINRLKLKGNELILFALIYGFSQHNDIEYKGSLNYISSALSISRRSVINILDKLIEKGFISKIIDDMCNKYKHTDLSVDFDDSAKSAPVQKVHRTSAKIAPLAGAKSSHNNNIYNNINNIYQEDVKIGDLNSLKANIKIVEKEKKRTREKSLFRNSIYKDFNNVVIWFKDHKDLADRFTGVDVKRYIENVEDWNDKQNTPAMRSDLGWIKTIKNFMQSDLDNNRLIKIKVKSNNDYKPSNY